MKLTKRAKSKDQKVTLKRTTSLAFYYKGKYLYPTLHRWVNIQPFESRVYEIGCAAVHYFAYIFPCYSVALHQCISSPT